MRSCKEVSRLISESLDRKLPLHHRLAVRVHLRYCKFCSRYQKQIIFMRNPAHRLSAEGAATGSTPVSSLSPEALESINRSLRKGNQWISS